MTMPATYTRTRLVAAAFAALAIARLAEGAEATPHPSYKPGLGPHNVHVIDSLILESADRDTPLQVKVYYPEEPGPYPVLVFSHGLGDSADGAARLAWYWCSHGYVCFHPGHATRGIPEHRIISGLIRMRRELRQLKEQGADFWAARAADIRLVLGRLPELADNMPELFQKVDTDAVAIAGHSFGANTAALMAGATLRGRDDGLVRRYGDKRFKALLMLSGIAADGRGFTRCSWETIRMPAMVVAGSRDPGPEGWNNLCRIDPFLLMEPGDKYLVFVEGAHHLTYVGFPCDIPKNPSAASPEFEAVRAVSLAFWDAYLKEDTAARAFLESRRVAPATGGVVALASR